MKHLRRAVAALAVSAVIVPGASAQQIQQQPPEASARQRVMPGWIFTPSIAFGVTYDDNPVLATRGNPSPNDTLGLARPGLSLAVNGRHTNLGLRYTGALLRYQKLTQYNAYDQGGSMEFRTQPSRRARFFVRDTFFASPTTDTVQVAGVPFRRTGTRNNDVTTGLTVDATKGLAITGTYHFQWIDFSRSGLQTNEFLQGGRAHQVSVDARQRLTARTRLGVSWSYQHALLGNTREGFDIQDTEAFLEYQLSPTTTIEGGGGISHLALPNSLGTRTGPAGHVRITHRTEYALFSLSATRSFVPAFGFGGSLQNSEVTLSARAPLLRKRAVAETSIAWRNSQPVLERELGLKAFWLQAVFGYSLTRWLQVQGFYNGAFQDTTAVGGRVDRNRIGVQFVTAHPMRID